MLAALDARMIAHSGIGTHIRGLLQGVRELDRTAEVLLLGDPVKLEEVDEAAGFGIEPFSAKIYSVSEQMGFPVKKVRGRGVGIIHSPHYNIPLRASGLRRVVTIHDIIHLTHAKLSAVQRIYARTMLRAAVQKSDRLLTVSLHSAEEIGRAFDIPADSFTVTPNAPTDNFRQVPTPDSLRVARGKYRLPAAGYFLTVGINKPHKNLRLVVEACRDLWREGRLEQSLLVCGVSAEEGGDLLRVLEESRFRDRLRFLGRVDWRDLPALYVEAVALVFPSLVEGFGLPIVEAQSLGVPVVCSSAPPMPEVAGDAAFFFNPTDSRALTAALVRMANDCCLRDELSAAGPGNASRYSWRETARTVLEVYEGLAR